MAKFTAIYTENDMGVFELQLIVTKTFLSLTERTNWLVNLAQELADGDIWGTKIIEGEALEDFDLVLSA